MSKYFLEIIFFNSFPFAYFVLWQLTILNGSMEKAPLKGVLFKR